MSGVPCDVELGGDESRIGRGWIGRDENDDDDDDDEDGEVDDMVSSSPQAVLVWSNGRTSKSMV